jgi:hypothetical protein
VLGSRRRLGLIVVAGSLAPSTALDAGPSTAALAHVRAAEIDLARLTPLTRAAMRHELGALLAPASLALSWRTARPDGETDPDELRVVLLPRVGVGPDRGALGAAANRGLVRTIWVYVPSVATTLGLDPEAVVTSLESQRLVGVALGRVVAHELVHALAPAVEHAGGGLMRPRLHAVQLVRGRPALDGDCAASLAAGARAWLATSGLRRAAARRAPDEPAVAAGASDGSPE